MVMKKYTYIYVGQSKTHDLNIKNKMFILSTCEFDSTIFFILPRHKIRTTSHTEDIH